MSFLAFRSCLSFSVGVRQFLNEKILYEVNKIGLLPSSVGSVTKKFCSLLKTD